MGNENTVNTLIFRSLTLVFIPLFSTSDRWEWPYNELNLMLKPNQTKSKTKNFKLHQHKYNLNKLSTII